ncbi:MIT C-terminal domain-containing protein [Dysgonomonas massiliensis]|uniref:MIT C-terminal domain-containing protein n=1 Tax=Dysgonomonas massiliensis TaxID=2040292 RepID=UPI002481FB10|nr:MIT C-terminal domain-containing protein [Dysgonomonas massiliensis]
MSYDHLFGQCLEGAIKFIIQDPYIRLPHQFKNFLELCVLISKKNSRTQLLTIHLITWNDLNYMEMATSTFDQIKDSLFEFNIEIDVEFKESAHDRFILCDNRWKIILGRSLDIW